MDEDVYGYHVSINCQIEDFIEQVKWDKCGYGTSHWSRIDQIFNFRWHWFLLKNCIFQRQCRRLESIPKPSQDVENQTILFQEKCQNLSQPSYSSIRTTPRHQEWEDVKIIISYLIISCIGTHETELNHSHEIIDSIHWWKINVHLYRLNRSRLLILKLNQ